MNKHQRPSKEYDDTYDPSRLVLLLKRYGEVRDVDDDYMSQLHFLAAKAADEIEQLSAKVEKYEKWFDDHGSVLATHRIGGFKFGTTKDNKPSE